MAVQFTPLPLSVFPEEARPHIARLNSQLRDLFGLEGSLANPDSTKRSDATIARKGGPGVDATRVNNITIISGGSGSGSTTVVGTPNLTFTTSNGVGSTTTVVSINSSIALFGTQLPIGISTGAALGTSAYAARADHVHGISITGLIGSTGSTVGISGTVSINTNFNDALPAAPSGGINARWRIDTTTDPDNISVNVPVATPAFVLTTIAAEGTSTNSVRADAQIAIFDGSNPTTLTISGVADDGAVAKAARRDHRHALDIIDDGVAIESFAGAASNGTDNFLARTDHVHKSETSQDWYANTAGKGMITKDVQSTPRYWRILVQGSTTAVTGGCTISITSTGTVSAARDAGAAGTLVIRIDDFGTAAP